MNTREDIDPRLDAHIRRTLREVACSVPGASADSRSASRSPIQGARRGRWLALVAAVVLAIVGLTLRGGAFERPDRVVAGDADDAGQATGPEYVDQLPPDGVVQSGTAGEVDWWLIDSFHENGCGQPMPGLELVIEDRNPGGQVWQTTGVLYGESLLPGQPGCLTESPIADPSYMWSNVDHVDGHRLVTMGVHPSIAALVVTVGDDEPFRVETVADPDRPDGPRYAGFTAPTATAGLITVEGVDANGARLAEWDNSDLNNPPPYNPPPPEP